MPAVEAAVNLLTGAMGGGEAGGVLGGLPQLTGGLTKLVGIGMGVHGMLSTVVSMFKPLLAVTRGIFKTIGLILRPITDLLAIGLMPILFILRPIALFFNTLMRPYIQKAMAAMRAGGQFIQAGMPEQAVQAFALGFQFLIQPIVDAFAAAFPALGGVAAAWGQGLEEQLVLATTSASLAISDDVQEMMSNLQRNFEILNRLGIDPSVIDAVYGAIREPLERAQGYVTDEWGLYNDAVTVMKSLADYVAGTGMDKWGMYNSMTRHLGEISTWAESQWAFQTQVQSKLEGITMWISDVWDFDTMVKNKFLNLRDDVNDILDEIDVSRREIARGARRSVFQMGVFGPLPQVLSAADIIE